MEESEAIKRAFASNPRMADVVRRMRAEGKIKLCASDTPAPDDKEPIVIVCVPWSYRSQIDGTKVGRCCSCKTEVSLAPSTQRLMASLKNEPSQLCVSCVPLTLETMNKASSN